MSRYTGPKNRIARRFGVNIFATKRNPMLHKPNPPGMHGAKRKKKSDFGLQLEEKQKLRAVYGMIRQKQLIRLYKAAAARPGNTAMQMIQALECRLDVVVYRLRLASTIFMAQQLVAHGHIRVNGKKVDRRSFNVKPGMEISLSKKALEMITVKASLEDSSREVPEYLTLDSKKGSGKLEILPESDQIPLPLQINVPLVCEFLAHTC
jgi:small subunit ribosomal protein S4